MLLQLEARPTGRGDGCIQPAVGEVQRVREPSMVLGGQSSVTGATTASPSNPGGPCVEQPALVSSPAGDTVQLSTATSSHTEPTPVDIQCESNGSPTQLAAWPVAGKKFGRGGLSEAAKELLLASWTTKTSRAYDSHFKKWLAWCTERGLDHVSGPNSDVANFLADLHTQG